MGRLSKIYPGHIMQSSVSARFSSVLSAPHISSSKKPGAEIQRDVKRATRNKRTSSDKYQTSVAVFVQQNYNNEEQLVSFFDALNPKLISSDVVTALKAHYLFHTNVFSDMVVHPHYKYSTMKIFIDKYVILPNLGNASKYGKVPDLPQLLVAYNRYLNQRLLDYSKLKMDLIREKRYEKKSNPSTPTSPRANLAQDFDLTNNVLKHTRCAMSQVRLILDCLFPADIVHDQTLLTMYNLLAIDLSILFSIICNSFVLLLQNFFSLVRPDAERTLFLYKEFTQLQIPEEVAVFVDMAPNMANPHDLSIPSAIKKSPEEIKKLHKALESYLYADTMGDPTSPADFYTPPTTPFQLMTPLGSHAPPHPPLPHSNDLSPPYLVASSPGSLSSPLCLDEFDDSWASSVMSSLDSDATSILAASTPSKKPDLFVLGPAPPSRKKSILKKFKV